MMYRVGETDAGSVAVGQAHRTVSLSNRLPVGCTQTGPGERSSPFTPLSPPVAAGYPELPHALENSDLPKAGRALISERHLSNSG